MRRRASLLATLGALTAVMLAAPAAGADGPVIAVDPSRLGHIDLLLGDVQGTTGRFFERVGARRIPLGEVTIDGPAAARLTGALTWSCTRRTRRLVVDVIHPDGTTASATYAIRTPGCRDRLIIEAPRSAPPGARIAVGVLDRWGLGDIAPRLCVRSPSGRRACRTVRFASRARAELPVRLTRDGAWGLDLVLGRLHTRRALTAGLSTAPGRGPAQPTVLVTGDSTVQGIDAALGDRLRRSVQLVRDFRPGSGISHDDWPRIAAAEARRFKPRATVISIGATDGYPMRLADGTSVACCAAPWQAEYQRRARAVMTAFVRGGRGYALWLTLPTPQDPRRAAISAVVNAAVERAAATVPGVVIVRLDRVLSPGWRYRRYLRYHGTRRVVRTPDGIHLTPAGAAIATDLILRALSRLPWAADAPR
jgi:hypothetical protein